MKRATFLRTGVVLLAAGLVIAVTWARFSPYDLAGVLAAREAAAKGQAPAAGAEAVLRRHIATPPPSRGTDVAKLGPLQSIGYLGSTSESARRIDNFRVTYRNGILIWRVGLGRKGTPDIIDYDNPEPPTPAQMVASLSGVRASRVLFVMATKFALLLIVAAMSRFVLRISL
jgi:hypothetical protein